MQTLMKHLPTCTLIQQVPKGVYKALQFQNSDSNFHTIQIHSQNSIKLFLHSAFLLCRRVTKSLLLKPMEQTYTMIYTLA